MKPHHPSRLAHFPVSMFSLVMGMAGTTIAFEKMDALMLWSIHLNPWLLAITTVVYALIAFIYSVKCFMYSSEVLAEFNHPIRMSFFPTISIGSILLSVVWLQVNAGVAQAFWFFGSILQLIFTLVILSTWIHHDKFQVGHSNPAWFIPIVGNILVPISGMNFGYSEISWFYFSVGMMMWLPMLAVMLNRFFFHPMMPAKLMPTLFILIAPPAVGCISWVKLHHGAVDDVARLLYYFGLFTTLLLLSQFKYFAPLKFALPWWAYSFPMAAMTSATLLMFEKLGGKFFLFASYGLFALLCLLMLVLLVKTIAAIRAGEICVPE